MNKKLTKHLGLLGLITLPTALLVSCGSNSEAATSVDAQEQLHAKVATKYNNDIGSTHLPKATGTGVKVDNTVAETVDNLITGVSSLSSTNANLISPYIYDISNLDQTTLLEWGVVVVEEKNGLIMSAGLDPEADLFVPNTRFTLIQGLSGKYLRNGVIRIRINQGNKTKDLTINLTASSKTNPFPFEAVDYSEISKVLSFKDVNGYNEVTFNPSAVSRPGLSFRMNETTPLPGNVTFNGCSSTSTINNNTTRSNSTFIVEAVYNGIVVPYEVTPPAIKSQPTRVTGSWSEMHQKYFAISPSFVLAQALNIQDRDGVATVKLNPAANNIMQYIRYEWSPNFVPPTSFTQDTRVSVDAIYETDAMICWRRFVFILPVQSKAVTNTPTNPNPNPGNPNPNPGNPTNQPGQTLTNVASVVSASDIKIDGKDGEATITLPKVTGMTLTASKSSMISNGDTITVTVSANSGYKLLSGQQTTLTINVSGLTKYASYIADKLNYQVSVSNMSGIRHTDDLEANMYRFNTKSYWDGFSGKKYTITGIGDAKFNIVIDNKCKTTEAEDKNFIDKFLNETNWGVGLLTIRNIYILSDYLRMLDGGLAGGVGDAGLDIISVIRPVDAPESGWSAEQWRARQLQLGLQYAQHEYGHHETLTMYNNFGAAVTEIERVQPMSDALIKYGALAGNVAQARIDAVRGNITRLNTINNDWMAQLHKLNFWKPVSTQLNKIFGEDLVAKNMNDVYGSGINFDYLFNAAEYLNRFINVFDIYDMTEGKATWTLYDSPTVYEMLMFYGNGFNNTPILDVNDSTVPFTAEAMKTYDLYTKYVYGFNNPDVRQRLLVDGVFLRGYTDQDIDFARVVIGADGMVGRKYGNQPVVNGMTNSLSEEVLKIRKIPTHFFTRDTLFGTKHFADTHGYGVYLAISDIKYDQDGGSYSLRPYDPQRLIIINDTDNDGKIDWSKDADVTNRFKNYSNFNYVPGASSYGKMTPE